jgi:hypothetical protein
MSAASSAALARPKVTKLVIGHPIPRTSGAAVWEERTVIAVEAQPIATSSSEPRPQRRRPRRPGGGGCHWRRLSIDGGVVGDGHVGG